MFAIGQELEFVYNGKVRKGLVVAAGDDYVKLDEGNGVYKTYNISKIEGGVLVG